MTLPTLHIATPSQHLLTLQHTHLAWASTTPFNQYLKRETTLRSTPIGKNMTCFILLQEGQIISSCEIYKRPCFLNNRASYIYAVTAVITPEAHRGKGYASLLINGVKGVIDGLGGTSILYSEVGAFYERFGWKAYEVGRTVVPVQGEFKGGHGGGLRVVFGGDEGLREVVGIHVERTMGKEGVYIPPTVENLVWHYVREDSITTTPQKGARFGSSYILWYHDFEVQQLIVMLYYFDTDSDRDVLLNEARREASTYGLLKGLVF